MPDFDLRRAREQDAGELTRLAIASKRSWGYPDALIEAWLPELEFTPESIRANGVIVAEREGRVVGVVAVSRSGTTAELEGLWVHPSCFGQGLGRALFVRAVADARSRGVRSLLIDSDPHAEEFYLGLGALRSGSVPSTPPGRRLPRLVFHIAG